MNKPRNWSAAELSNDYGIDYFIQVFDKETGIITPITFVVQLKGTKNYNQNETHVKYRIKTKYLKYYYTRLDIPAFLVVVDTVNDNYCWLFIQKYVHETLNKENPNWVNQDTVTVHLPKENTFLNPEIIENCANTGSSYCNLLIHGAHTHELIMNVKNIIDKSEYFANEYETMFDLETKDACSLLNENILNKSKEEFESVYNKTKEEKYVFQHLRSIIGLLNFYRYNDENESAQFFQLIDEGLKLSMEHELSPLIHYFKGRELSNLCYTLQGKLPFLLFTKSIYDAQNNLSEVEFPKNHELNNIFDSLKEIYNEFSKILMETIDNEELITFIDLLSSLIRMKMQYIDVSYDTVDDIILNDLLNQINQLISIFKDLIEIFDQLIDYKYDLFNFEFVYSCMVHDEKCHEILEEYIKFADENDSKYHMEKAGSLKNIIPRYFPDDVEKDDEFSKILLNDLEKFFENK